MIVGRSEYNVKQCANFLEEMGIKAVATCTLKDGLKQLTKLRPTHAFFSTQLGVASLDGVARMFEETEKTICYVFPEDNTLQSSTDVKFSTVKNKMYVNISGGGINMIIDAWSKEQDPNHGKKKKAQANFGIVESDRSLTKASDFIGSVRLTGKSLPDDHGTVSSLFNDNDNKMAAPISSQQPENDLVEKSTSISEDQVYDYFQGSNIGILRIKSSVFEGYAVFLTTETNYTSDQEGELVDYIREGLRQFLSRSGRSISDDQTISVQDIQVLTDGYQFALFMNPTLQFIEGVQEQPLISPSSEEMLAVKVDVFDTEFPVPFDVFVFLELNNRFVRYVAEGSKMTANHLEKLKNKNVEYVHIKKENLKLLENYCKLAFIHQKLQNLCSTQNLAS